MAGKLCPSFTGSIIVKLSLPAGAVANRRKMMLLRAAITGSLPDLVVSNSTDPSRGYVSTSGNETVEAGNASRLSSGVLSAKRFTSVSSRANCAALTNDVGGRQFFQSPGCHGGNA